ASGGHAVRELVVRITTQEVRGGRFNVELIPRGVDGLVELAGSGRGCVIAAVLAEDAELLPVIAELGGGLGARAIAAQLVRAAHGDLLRGFEVELLAFGGNGFLGRGRIEREAVESFQVVAHAFENLICLRLDRRLLRRGGLRRLRLGREGRWASERRCGERASEPSV